MGDRLTQILLEYQNLLLTNVNKNEWTKNNGNVIDNGYLTNNLVYTASYIDVKEYELNSGSKIRCVLITGKCNMTNESDTFNIVFSNGGDHIWGQAIRPELNTFDNMYHFTYEITAFTKAINVGNKCGTDITNFTLNYTFLK